MMPVTAEKLTSVPARESRSRFSDLIAAEWLKMWSLRSTPWAYVISALVVVGFNVGAAYNQYHYWYEDDVQTRAHFVPSGAPLLFAFTDNAVLAMILAAGAIGAVAITSEYGTGLIRTTFAAVPARRSVMAAKVLVTAVAMTVFGAVVAAVSFALSQAILSGRHAGVSIGSPGALRVVVASAVIAPVAALVGMAIGAVVRRSAPAVVGCVGLLLLLPMVVTDRRHVTAIINHMLPLNAWRRLVAVHYDQHAIAFPWTVSGAWIVYAAWVIVAVGVAVSIVHYRDQ